jgi:aminopeptidase N
MRRSTLPALAGFELRYLLRNPIVWSAAAVTLLMFFAASAADGFELGSEGGLLRNAAYATVRGYLGASVLFMFVTTAFVAGAVIRDDETGFGPIIRSTGVTKRDYLFGRFLGAFAVAALCLLAVPLGAWLGSLMPWVDPAVAGAFRPGDHLYGYLFIALPNVFVTSAVFFALATTTRSMLATYLGVIGFVSLYFVLENAFGDRPQLVSVIALADPFGARAISDVTRYWTIAERNVTLPGLTGTLLANRLLWVGIGGLFLAIAFAVFRFAEKGMSKRELGRQKLTERASSDEHVVATAVLPSPRHDAAGLRALLWMRTRFETRQVVLSPAFVLLMAWGLFTTLITLTTQRDPDGRPTYPTTLSLIPELEDGFWFIPFIVAIYYAGELVWRERDRRVHELIDVTPMPNWIHVVSKTCAMALVLVAMLMTTVVAAIAVQLSLGYTDLELDKYLLWYVLPLAWDMLLVAALAVFVQSLSPHKAVGWGITLLYYVWLEHDRGFDNNLLVYGGTPRVPLSDMNDAGSFWIGAWVFRLYWGALAALLLVGAHVLWRRGTETRLRPRLAGAWRRLAGAPGWIAGAALAVVVAAGAVAYYNVNVVNDYRTRSEMESTAADLERRYWKYHGLPQPTIADIRLDVALYPEDRRAVTKGRFLLRNVTTQEIPEIHVRVLDGDLELTAMDIDGARLVVDDEMHRYRIFRLDQPMRPNEERALVFESIRHIRGFRNREPETRLVENGTFLSESEIAPVIGMGDAGLMRDPATRRSHGLPETLPTPRLDDSTTTQRATMGRGWATVDITVSTAADQTPLAPGNKVSDVTRGARRIARFVSDVPVRSRFTVLSARYAVKHRRHAGVLLSVYHHPAHGWNVDRMLEALAASLDYYRASFGPYQFDHARIVEFPGYHGYAQAFAGTIPYSETVGFISDYDEPETIDHVAGMTAHELAHQYWAHQVAPAETVGAGVLTETLAQYSALMVVRRMRGGDQIRRRLQFELDRYLDARSEDDPPLIRELGHDHLVYRKGALVMYLLQERMGEEAVNRALRTLVDRFKFKGPPFARSLDLVAALRAEATTAEHQELITDLFERVTLYDLQADAATAVRRADGRWDVTITIDARKVYVGTGGAETEAPLDERIEVGLFTDEPGRDAFDRSDAILLERRPIRSGRQVLRFTTDRKPRYAGVDPYNYYIDRESGDNVVGVE